MLNTLFKIVYYTAFYFAAFNLGCAVAHFVRGEPGPAFFQLFGAVCWIGARHYARLNLIREGLLTDDKKGGPR